MINNTLRTLTPLLAETHSIPLPSNNDEGLPGKINSVHNQQIKITDLPIEIKQLIAFKLKVNSYERLRLTSKKMSDALLPIKDMRIHLKNNCSGYTKRKYEALIFEKNIKSIISDRSNDEIIQTLKNVTVLQHRNFSDIIILSTEFNLKIPFTSYAPPLDGTEESKIYLSDSELYCKIFTLCVKEIGEKSNNEDIIIELVSKIQPLYIKGCKSAHLLFFKDQITCQTLDVIFSSFNKLFHKEDINDQLLLAICAARLREYWCENPPNDMSKNDIVNCTSKYPDLFTTEKIIAEHLQ